MEKLEPAIEKFIRFLFADKETQNDTINNVVNDSINNAVREIHLNLIDANVQSDDSKHLDMSAGVNLSDASTQSFAVGLERSKSELGKLRRNLVPKDANLHILDTQIYKIYTELSSLKVKNYPNAAAVLFRVFIEISCKHYVEKHKLDPQKSLQTLASHVKVVSQHLVKSGHLTESVARPMITVTTDKDHLFGVTTLNQLVHSSHQRAVPGDLIRHWDNIAPFMEAIWRKE